MVVDRRFDWPEQPARIFQKYCFVVYHCYCAASVRDKLKNFENRLGKKWVLVLGNFFYIYNIDEAGYV